ncbi:isthmin-like [Frankliniella occidentalis]|uniref:Isthmin-like n=1 Tax=Frankliniella occidentalis TaxID=133901 RepID=A0A6J1TA01_FRAOC|nr:isthmin-like [Frankliniella occidentalis]
MDDPTTTLAPATVAASFKAKGGRHHGGRGRGRPTPGDVDVEGKPLDPEWLQRLLAAAGAAAATSSSGLEAPGADEFASPCDRWMACSAKLRPVMWAQLAALPACPCTFPANVFYYNKIWDDKHGRYFRWRDASGRGERLDVYHPGAAHCVRSLHTANAGLLAAQHCCYDRNRQLLTRGSGAGTPALMSPDVSAALHDILDIRPWRICKGDFTRYNDVRPPNNDNDCAANPDEDEFQRQVDMAQFY